MRNRGFEGVSKEHMKYKETVTVHGNTFEAYPYVKLPRRADDRSAGYDFYSPVDMTILPGGQQVIWTNIKAYMQENEVLSIHPRSSLGIKQGIVLANTTGIIDASYYQNEGNDGNIGIALKNTSGVAVHIKAGDRIAQGIFTGYLVVDNDDPLSEERVGGIGSSGK